MRVISLVRAYETFTRWCAYLAAGLILAMALWITYDVISRYLLINPTVWGFDLSEYTLLWVTFLAAPWILLRDGHVRVELLVDVLPTTAQRWLGVGLSLLAAAACVILAWQSGESALEYYSRDIMMPRLWRIPKYLPYAIIPIGSALLVLAFLVRAAIYAREPDPEHMFHECRSDGTGYGDTATGGVQKERDAPLQLL